MDRRLFRIALLAGLCGGTAEMLWVACYGLLAPVSAIEVARQVAASVFPVAADWPAAPLLGVAIHLLLSLALGLVFVRLVWVPFARRLDSAEVLLVSTAALLMVWAVNFLFILPRLNPAFIRLMPYAVTLFSKALFGVAMAWVLRKFGGWRRIFR